MKTVTNANISIFREKEEKMQKKTSAGQKKTLEQPSAHHAGSVHPIPLGYPGKAHPWQSPDNQEAGLSYNRPV